MGAMTQSAFKGFGMEGWLARWYARTRRNDMADFRQQAQAVAARLVGRRDVLEVAPGPGFFAIELAKRADVRVTALDISRSFVAMTAENATNAGVTIDVRLGNAAAMPLADAAFDLVYCSAAFKNFAEPVKALDEMHRVLRPGGEAIISDLRKDVAPAEIEAYVRRSGRTRLDAWITIQIFRHMLIGRAYTREAIERMAASSQFRSCQITSEPIGFEARFAKAALPD